MESGLLNGWAKRLARRHSRRAAIGAAGLGAFGVLGLSSTVAQDDDLDPQTTGMGDDGICRMAFEGNVRLGPSNDDGEPFAVTGLLAFKIGDGGGLTDGSLTTADQTYPMSGQGSGKTMTFRIKIADGLTFIGVGAGENSVRSCNGEYGGPASGPIRGDLGDWIATAAAASATEPTVEATVASTVEPNPEVVVTEEPTPAVPPPPDPTETPCPFECEAPWVLDPETCGCNCDTAALECYMGREPSAETCTCECPNDTDPCFGRCCPPGTTCGNGGFTCICPDGEPICNDVCIDRLTDPNNCGLCGNACAFDEHCENGECVELGITG